MNWRRIAILTTVAIAGAFLSAPSVVAAPPDPSAVAVSPTSVAPGQTFTVTVELHNPQNFTVTFAKAAIYGLETPIVDIADVESCSGTTGPCSALGGSYRGPVGDLLPGQTRTVVFTLRVKETAAAGQFTLQHQLVGDNFAFDIRNGPVVTITSQLADLAVSLDASPRGILTSRITYTITVANTGPGNATGVRVTANYAAGLNYAGSTDCTRVAGTRTVHCDIASIPAGGSATAQFSATAGLLSIGSFTTTAQRTDSAPADPNSANDTARRSCSALTSLLVSC